MKYIITVEGECLPRATANKMELILKDPKNGLQMMDGTVISVEVMETERCGDKYGRRGR